MDSYSPKFNLKLFDFLTRREGRRLNIGKSIRIAMATQDLDNETVAKRVGWTAHTVSRYRNRRHCNTEDIERFAAAFGMSPFEFLKLGEEEAAK